MQTVIMKCGIYLGDFRYCSSTIDSYQKLLECSDVARTLVESCYYIYVPFYSRRALSMQCCDSSVHLFHAPSSTTVHFRAMVKANRPTTEH